MPKKVLPYKILNQKSAEICGGYATLGILQQYYPSINLVEMTQKLDSHLSEGKHMLTMPAIRRYFSEWNLIKDIKNINADEAINLLKNNHPVLISSSPIDWDSTGKEPFHVVKTNDFIAGHFWYAIGIIQDDSKNGVCIVKCVNSWGEEWGDKGHFYMNIYDRIYSLNEIII